MNKVSDNAANSKRLGSLRLLDGGSFDHPSYMAIKGIEDALVKVGIERVVSASFLRKLVSRAIIKYDLTRFYIKLSKHIYVGVIMNLPARRFYPQGLWSESIIYCFDSWGNRQSEWARFLRRNRTLIAFFTARQSASALASQVPDCKIFWLPEAIDPAPYLPNRPLNERRIDLLEFGRSWPAYHAAIAPHCSAVGHVHRFPQHGKLLFPTQDELYRGLGDAILVVCVPQSLSHPQIAGSTETMTLRYLEVIASGALILGRCPSEMADLFGYNPVIEIDEINPGCQLDAILANLEKYEWLRNKNIVRLYEVATWDRRANEMMKIIAENL